MFRNKWMNMGDVRATRVPFCSKLSGATALGVKVQAKICAQWHLNAKSEV
jgi:hypothetical protein